MSQGEKLRRENKFLFCIICLDIMYDSIFCICFLTKLNMEILKCSLFYNKPHTNQQQQTSLN